MRGTPAAPAAPAVPAAPLALALAVAVAVDGFMCVFVLNGEGLSQSGIHAGGGRRNGETREERNEDRVVVGAGERRIEVRRRGRVMLLDTCKSMLALEVGFYAGDDV